jgi:hypothetical protein
MLCGLVLVRETFTAEGHFFDPPSAFDDGLIASEEDVGRCELSEALVIRLDCNASRNPFASARVKALIGWSPRSSISF